MSVIDTLFSGKGAREVRIVWGTFRAIAHAYRFNIFGVIDGKPVGSIDYITLCGRTLRPKGDKTAEADPPPAGACRACADALPKPGAKPSGKGRRQ